MDYIFEPPRVDFDKESFDKLVTQKGRDVLFEKALRCPCKSRGSDSLGRCKNCAGTSWIFVNPIKVRMVVQGMSIATNQKAWSEEERGLLNVTTVQDNKLSFMDRITIVDSVSVHTEVLHFKLKQSNNKYFAYTTYRPKSIEYAGLFLSVDKKLTVLSESQCYFEDNIVYLSQDAIDLVPSDEEEISISIRYFHAPSYHVVENKRDTMDTFVVENGKEDWKKLPIAAFARRAHYILDMQNLNGTRLLKNDYEEKKCDQTNIFTNEFNTPFK